MTLESSVSQARPLLPIFLKPFGENLAYKPLLKLTVQTQDADNLRLLDNAKLTLAEALKCDSEGNYQVYVKTSLQVEGFVLFFLVPSQ